MESREKVDLLGDSQVVETSKAALSHVRESENSSQQKPSQFQKEGNQNSNSDAVLADTTLSDVPLVAHTSALSRFHDVAPIADTHLNIDNSKVVDANFVFPKGYFSVCERMLPILTAKLPSTTPTPYPYLRIDPLSPLLATPMIKDKFRNVINIRYNMEIQIKILATHFHYGQLLVVFRPAYFPYLKLRTALINDESKGPYTSCLTIKESWEPYGPFDSVFTASQLDHKILPVTAGSSVTISVPWSCNFQYAPVWKCANFRYHIGFLDIYMLTPIYPADADACSLQVFARFADIEGFGYMSNDGINAYLPIPNSYGIDGEEEKSDNYALVPYSPATIGCFMNNMSYGLNLQDITVINNKKLDVYARWNNYQGQFKGATKTLYAGFDQEPRIRNFKELATSEKITHSDGQKQKDEAQSMEEANSVLGWSRSVARSIFSRIASTVSGQKVSDGLCKVVPKRLPQSMFLQAPPFPLSVAEDFTTSTGYINQDLVPVPKNEHSDKTDLSNLAATYTYMGYRAFTSSGRSSSFKFSPFKAIFNTFQDACVMTPASYIAHRFAFWRGSFKYRVHFSSSAFVNVRFAIRPSYTQFTSNGITPTQYVEVKGDAVVEGEIPYLFSAPWARCDNNDMCYQLDIEMMQDSLVAWKKDIASPIVATLWIAMGDFQVAQPRLSTPMIIPWGFGAWFEGSYPTEPDLASIPRRERALMPPSQKKQYISKLDLKWPYYEEVQSGDLPGTIQPHETFSIGMGDIPQSVYHIAKRYIPCRATCLVPLAPLMLVATRTNVWRGSHYATYYPNTIYFAALFRWVSGSANVVADSVNSIVDVPFLNGPYELFIHDKELQHSSEISLMLGQFHPFTMKMSNNMIAIRQPFRSQVPFVSSPHLFYSWDRQASYDGCHAQAMTAGPSPPESLQALFFDHANREASNRVMWSFADDLCYKQFMGIPMQGACYYSRLATAMYGDVAV